MAPAKAPRQQLINSFFGPPVLTKKPQQASTKANTTAATPQRNSFSVRPAHTHSTAKGAFDEIGSSDTSFGSPEVSNFKNPALNRSISNVSAGLPQRNKVKIEGSKTPVVSLDEETDNDKENHQIPSSPVAKPKLEHSNSSSFLDFMNSRPRKIAKKAPSYVTPIAPLAEGKEVELSSEQLEIINIVVNKGQNVFFTGSAGTGKSVVLRQLVSALNRKYGQANVGVTASTGLAACNIGGQTVHKFLGIGLGAGSPEELARKIKRNGGLKKRWKTLVVLVIDEISMIDGKLFTKLDHLGKLVRENTAPFGGIQLVCTGDFYQLPPVAKDQGSQYCFQSDSWTKAITHTITLTQIFRQKGDSELIDMLNALRKGELDNSMIMKFHQLLRKVKYDDGIEPTELFPTRQEVKRANEYRLLQLPGKLFSFQAKDNTNDAFLKKLYDNMMCEERLDLKEGAQVMYLKNHPDDIVVNGSIGTVIGFVPESVWGLVVLMFGIRELINPSMDILNLLKLLSNLVGKTEFSDHDGELFSILPPQWRSKVEKLRMEMMKIPSTTESLPIVNFKTGLDDFTIILVRREEFSADPGNVVKQPGMPQNVVREQLPLLLAWAMSIHKAQGQSIDRLRVDLRKIFEKGQVYVALSRATNKDQLEVLNFDHRRIRTSPEVKNFYDTVSGQK